MLAHPEKESTAGRGPGLWWKTLPFLEHTQLQATADRCKTRCWSGTRLTNIGRSASNYGGCVMDEPLSQSTGPFGPFLSHSLGVSWGAQLVGTTVTYRLSSNK